MDPARTRAPVAFKDAAAAHADRLAHPVDAAHPGDLFHHGVSGTPEKLRTRAGRAFLDALDLADDARERIAIALAMVDAIDSQIAPLERELRQLARRQTGCRALMELYGMGELTSLVTLCELGDVTRLSASRKAVRMAGIDIGVHRSDRRARVGKLNRQAPRSCAGRSTRPRSRPADPPAPTTPTSSHSRPAGSATRARR
jgi:acyl-CoA synthetase (AMP-forming)/AMP-acid ligase II